MTILISLVLVIAAIGLFFLIRSKSDDSPRTSTKARKTTLKSDRSETTRWRSVEIRPGLIACRGVSKIANKVFLASEAPSLPLGTCSEKTCQCKYLHLDDRRSGEDRRSPITQIGALFVDDQDDDRRATIGRRATDLAA